MAHLRQRVIKGLSNANTAWDSLKERLDNYHGVMLHQLEEAKLNLRHQVLAVHDEQERWTAKWKARPDVITRDWIEMMREKWTNLTEQRDILVNDCKRLNLPVHEIFESDERLVSQMESELEAEELNCKYQGEFLEELQRHEEEEWSVARRRMPKLHDWIDSWESRIQLHSRNQSGESLQEESAKEEALSFIERKIADLRGAIEYVQLLRGDELAEEHWNELKEILQLTRVKRNDDITLGHLIESAELIRNNVEKIRVRHLLEEIWNFYTD